jgi:parallel beta-helix repeat protein
MGLMAVYLDDCASGTTIYGNVFRGCTRAAFVGGGRDNLIENNIFVDCDPAVMIDGRGLDPSPVWHNMVYNTMKTSLDRMLGHSSTYLDRYPELRYLDEYYSGDSGVPPEGNRVLRNISSGGEWIKIHWNAEPEMVQIEDNLVKGDPGFIDAEGMDFGLMEDSPALKLGFKPIPFGEIGPRMKN